MSWFRFFKIGGCWIKMYEGNKVSLTILLLFLFSILITPYYAGAAEYIPRTHWAYDLLYHLAAEGYLKDYAAWAFDRDRTFTSRQVAEILAPVITKAISGEIKVNAQDWRAFELLVEEFKEDFEAAGLDIERFSEAMAVAAPPIKPLQYTLTFSVKETYFRFDKLTSYGEDYYYDTNLQLSLIANLSKGLNLFTKQASQWRIKAEDRHLLTRGFLSYKIKDIELQLGRDWRWYGTGYYGSLLLSDNAEPLEFLRAKYSMGSAKFDGFATQLKSKKYLFGHRLQVPIGRNAILGINDIIIVSQRTPEVYYFAASYGFVPFYLLQWLIDKDDNVLISFDTIVDLKEGLQVYGELLIDDIAVKPGEQLTKNALGQISGIYWASPKNPVGNNIRLEYAHIDPRVYLHRKSNNSYYDGADHALGHWLGEDIYYRGKGAQDLRAEVNYSPSKKLYLRGIYGIEDYGLEAQDKVSKRKNTIILQVRYNLTQRLALKLGYTKFYTLDEQVPGGTIEDKIYEVGVLSYF